MQWGDWSFDPDALTLDHETGYQIDLEEINSSAAMLDWIFQVRGKSWGDAETLYNLLTAFDDILDPQSNYCSFRKDTESDGGELARAFATKLREGTGEDDETDTSVTG